MKQFVTSDFKLGIIAGGQLGKLLILAASNWDVQTYVMDMDEDCPASSCCTNFVKGNPQSYDDVLKFGKMVDMITYELENINIEALKKLKQEGKEILPDPEILEIVQDKGFQKQFYQQHQIPTPPFQLFNNKEDILKALKEDKIQIPFVQKIRKGGYDGKGVCVIKDKKHLIDLLEGPSVIEKLIDIKKEIAVIAARNENGEIKCFPTVDMEFNAQANLVEQLICPATLNDEITKEAYTLATKIIDAFKACGLIAVEMFIDKEDKIWINEVAPRPHNSGHHTIESTITSQYEQLLRAIFNYPLGSTEIKIPAVMINLLGEEGYSGNVKYEGLGDCLKLDGVKVHLYGKKQTKPFRKMGHATIISKSLEEAKRKATIVKQKLKIKSWQNQK